MPLDAPHGFLPIGGPSKIQEWTVKASNKVYKHDLVVTTIGEGTIVRAAADQSEALATEIVGVALHGGDGDVTGRTKVAVETHPERVYQVQADTATWAITHIGDAVDVKLGSLPADIDQISQMEIDSVAAGGGANGCAFVVDRISGPEIGGGEIAWGTATRLKVQLRPLAMLHMTTA